MHREANVTLLHKKVQRQCRTIDHFSILVDHLSPIFCAKVRPQGLFGSKEEDFKRFLPYTGVAAILIGGRQLF